MNINSLCEVREKSCLKRSICVAVFMPLDTLITPWKTMVYNCHSSAKTCGDWMLTFVFAYLQGLVCSLL